MNHKQERYNNVYKHTDNEYCIMGVCFEKNFLISQNYVFTITHPRHMYYGKDLQ